MLKDGISVTVGFMKMNFSTRFWRESRAGSQAFACMPWRGCQGQGLGTPRIFTALVQLGLSTGWGGLKAEQQLQGEAEEMTVRGLERSREAHKVFLGLRLVSARSFPGLAHCSSAGSGQRPWLRSVTKFSCHFPGSQPAVFFPSLRSSWLPSLPVTKVLLGLLPLLPTDA